MADANEYKKQAAWAAVDLVKSGMMLGLGHGSTLQFALEAVAAKIKSGGLKDVHGVPSSSQTEAEAKHLGIPLIKLNADTNIDLTLDGADEVDPQLNLIKGGGGALLREKIVAQASRREVIMVDESKLSEKLGTRSRLPIEVTQFGWERQMTFIASLGGKASLRKTAATQPVLTDQGNYLLDCDFGAINDPGALARALEARSGIVEHGLFIGLATDVIVAGKSGIKHLKK